MAISSLGMPSMAILPPWHMASIMERKAAGFGPAPVMSTGKESAVCTALPDERAVVHLLAVFFGSGCFFT